MEIDYIIVSLQNLFDDDTFIRTEYIKTKDEKYLEQMKAIDTKSTNFIIKMLSEFGFPTISKVGKKPSFHAWKLVQHSSDTKLQERYLSLMEENLEDVNKRDFAYLKDRVLLSRGKQQVYGTQFKKNGNGKYVPINLWDIENVNKRRKEVELDSLEENIERTVKLYG